MWHLPHLHLSPQQVRIYINKAGCPPSSPYYLWSFDIFLLYPFFIFSVSEVMFLMTEALLKPRFRYRLWNSWSLNLPRNSRDSRRWWTTWNKWDRSSRLIQKHHQQQQSQIIFIMRRDLQHLHLWQFLHFLDPPPSPTITRTWVKRVQFVERSQRETHQSTVTMKKNIWLINHQILFSWPGKRIFQGWERR